MGRWEFNALNLFGRFGLCLVLSAKIAVDAFLSAIQYRQFFPHCLDEGDGSRLLLMKAVETEVSQFLAATANLKSDDGCQRVASRPRRIMIDIVRVFQPRVRDQKAGADEPAQGDPVDGCISNRAALAIALMLVQGAQKTWRRLDRTTSCQGSFKV